MNIPARVRFPLRVKLVLRAPVPAYILDNASPFSAHNSRWYDHSECEFTHSLRTRRRYCSRLARDRISWTKFVRSRLIPNISLRGVREKKPYQSRQFVRKTPFCSVMISSEVASHIVKPKRSMLSDTLLNRLYPAHISNKRR